MTIKPYLPVRIVLTSATRGAAGGVVDTAGGAAKAAVGRGAGVAGKGNTTD